MRHCLALDLVDDPELILMYERYHRDVWPEVLAHIRKHGVIDMQIFKLGTRLAMVLETDDTVFDAKKIDQAAASNEAIRRWEALMWKFQRPTP
ncbi:L-fucose mutarotase, type 2 [Candidatus Burkholderia humilis]|nr:L-fucose mutarotase, type 2 [Candidatus Burkholderia humilis]